MAQGGWGEDEGALTGLTHCLRSRAISTVDLGYGFLVEVLVPRGLQLGGGAWCGRSDNRVDG